MGKLDGKVAIITGGSRGIGKAVCIGFAKEGARVAVAARTVEPLKSGLPGTIHETLNEIKKVGGTGLAIQCNVAEETEVQAMVQKVMDEWGRIDVMVNNAGVAAPGPFVETTTKRWNLVVAINLLGTFLCTKAVVPIMIKQGGGSIINTSSVAARNKIYGTTGIAYGTVKSAIEHFTQSVASELSKYNIAVNCYDPLIGVASEGFVFNLPPDHPTRKTLVGPEFMVKAAILLAQQRVKGGFTGCVARDQEYIEWYNL